MNYYYYLEKTVCKGVWQGSSILKIYFGKTNITVIYTGYNYLPCTNLLTQAWHKLVTPLLGF